MTQTAQVEAEKKTSSVLENFVREEALARELKISRKTLGRWRKSGRGPRPAKIGRDIFYRRSAIEEWLLACESKPATKPRAPRQDRRTRVS
jgi:predicted DNA-binding transcriptional regulator AlpA